tara:strand:+ start:379 stop:1257 length:879 start_codon:yes stop_codon:yes gene_type:complete
MADEVVKPKSTGLLLIGIGPGAISGITSEALAAAKNADFRRYEAYTALWPEDELAALERITGPIDKIMRPEIEHPDEIFQLAKSHLVAIMVVGDPLQATTHVDLQLQALEQGIDCQVIHGISITNLVTGAIGLSNYKFGRQTTLTYPYSNWIATSPLEVIAVNRALGQHTLALLDLDPTGAGTGQQRPMKPIDALTSIALMVEKVAESIEETDSVGPLSALRQHALNEMISTPLEDLSVVLCSDMGTDNQSIVYAKLTELADLPGGEMNCLVFPASTSDVEDKALLRWKKQG